MFNSETSTLGVQLDKQGIRIDPARTSKVLGTPFPTNRKGMQSYCGFLSSLGLYSSNKLSRYHRVIAELTSATKDYIIEEKHRIAFEKTKLLLTEVPLFLNYPEPKNAKILYVDSSDIMLGAVLFDVVFPPVEVEEVECHYDIDTITSYSTNMQLALNKIKFPGFPVAIECKENSSFFEAMIFWTNTFGIQNVPNSHKLLRKFVLVWLDKSVVKHNFANALPVGTTWANFIQKYANTNSGLDHQNILVSLTAQILERHICLISETGIKIISGGTKADEKPRIWLYLSKERSEAKYVSIYKFRKTKDHPFSSNMKVKWDIQFMNKSDVFAALQTYVKTLSKSQFSSKVLVYVQIPPHDGQGKINLAKRSKFSSFWVGKIQTPD